MKGDLPPSSSESRLWLVAVARANRASDFGRTGERDLVHVRMLDQRLAGRAVAGDDVDHAGGQARFLANFREGQRRQRREFRGLQHDGVSGRQCRRNLPRQHQQRKIPRNDLPDDAAGHVLGKFLLQKLRPTRVMIEMPRDQRNVDVAALANRLAVVHRLEHREPPRMFLHQPRHAHTDSARAHAE